MKFFKPRGNFKHTELILLLGDIKCRNIYENATLPIQFQGSPYVVIRLTDSQKYKALHLLANDGNGGWNNHKKNWTPTENFSDRKLLFTAYYRNRLAKGFSKLVLYQTDSGQELRSGGLLLCCCQVLLVKKISQHALSARNKGLRHPI